MFKGVKFAKGTGSKKYKATLPNGKVVQFGHNQYEHYKDSIPPAQGGGIWSHKDHLDKTRRANYRKRHGAQGYHLTKYSPAWFSYYGLW